MGRIFRSVNYGPYDLSIIGLLVGSVGTYIKFTCKNRGVLGNRNAFLEKKTHTKTYSYYVCWLWRCDGRTTWECEELRIGTKGVLENIGWRHAPHLKKWWSDHTQSIIDGTFWYTYRSEGRCRINVCRDSERLKRDCRAHLFDRTVDEDALLLELQVAGNEALAGGNQTKLHPRDTQQAYHTGKSQFSRSA